MDSSMLTTLRSAQEAVTLLVEACRKGGTIYPRNPKAVAQVSRTGKWLLNAIAALDQALKTPCAREPEQKS